MNTIEFTHATQRLAQALAGKGALLLTRAGDADNVMTIGWGDAGVYWGLPVVTVPVRTSRHTHTLLDTSNDFIVFVPHAGQYHKELALCGSKSGRDVDKFELCGLTKCAAQAVDAPAIDAPGLYIECRVVYRQDMAGNNLSPDLEQRWYGGSNYHTFYKGQVLACYER